MSSPQVQMARQQQSIFDAVEAMREADLPTPRTDEVEMEPLVSDVQRIAAALGDAGENLKRLSRALDHTADHVDPSQDREIERLQKRVAALESAGEKARTRKK